jgi:hypothetical protein
MYNISKNMLLKLHYYIKEVLSRKNLKNYSSPLGAKMNPRSNLSINLYSTFNG